MTVKVRVSGRFLGVKDNKSFEEIYDEKATTRKNWDVEISIGQRVRREPKVSIRGGRFWESLMR